MINVAKYVPAKVLKWLLEQELTCALDCKLLASLSSEEATNFFYEVLRFSVQGTVDDYRILGGNWGFELGDISIKIFLWQGKEDNLLPMTHASYLAEKLRYSELFIASKQGHFLLRSIIDEVLSVLMS